MNPFNPLEKLSAQELRTSLYIIKLLRKRKWHTAPDGSQSELTFLCSNPQVTDHDDIIVDKIVKKLKHKSSGKIKFHQDHTEIQIKHLILRGEEIEHPLDRLALTSCIGCEFTKSHLNENECEININLRNTSYLPIWFTNNYKKKETLKLLDLLVLLFNYIQSIWISSPINEYNINKYRKNPTPWSELIPHPRRQDIWQKKQQ